MIETFELKEEKKSENYSIFVISPLSAGDGYTFGNSLRRILLSRLSGTAITQVKISGVRHQFSTLKGMKEDVVDFLLNLKKVRIAFIGDKHIGHESVKLYLSAKEGIVTAGKIKVPATVKVVNPDLVLASLQKGSKLEVEMEAEVGVGYSPMDERKSGKIGLLVLDAYFSPVLRVNYKVEETRVGRLTNYDKLTLGILTDGTITPKEALTKSASILVDYFNQIVTPKKAKKEEVSETTNSLGTVGKLSVEEIGLPTRVANALVKAGYETVERLVTVPKDDLVNVRNLGEKSLKIIKLALLERGVDFNNA